MAVAIGYLFALLLKRTDATYDRERDVLERELNLRDVRLRDVEYQLQSHIASVLRQEGGRVRAAARKLGMPRSTLYLKIKQLGIDLSKF